jgi:hypothetical protein
MIEGFHFQMRGGEAEKLANTLADAEFCKAAASCESQKLLSLRLNHCRNPQ